MSTKLARTVADARRLKVWLPQGDAPAARLLEAFRIAPTPLTIAEVLGGLQTGLIDTVAAPPVAAVPLLWHTRLRYVLELPLMYIYGLFVVSESSLRGIDAADRETMMRIMGEATTSADRRNRADHNAAWQTLADQRLEFIRPTPAERDDWRGYVEKEPERWVEVGVISGPMYAKLAEELAAVRSRGGEQAAGTATQAPAFP